MDELKKIIATNLVKFRKSAKLTQLELAEKLKYSDKNISKWERGESVPDVLVLKQLADMYSVSVNDFLVESDDVLAINTQEKLKTKSRTFNKKQLLITLLSASLVWVVAIVVFGLLRVFSIYQDHAWKCFILAIPICSIVVLVFSSIWCTNLLNAMMVTILIWTTAVACYICIPVHEMWIIFILAIPVQILDLLWFTLKKVNIIQAKKMNKKG